MSVMSHLHLLHPAACTCSSYIGLQVQTRPAGLAAYLKTTQRSLFYTVGMKLVAARISIGLQEAQAAQLLLW